jgi:hypothetical protein
MNKKINSMLIVNRKLQKMIMAMQQNTTQDHKKSTGAFENISNFNLMPKFL